MNRHDKEQHSQRIESLLMEAEDLERAFAVSDLASCAECTQLVEEHQRLTLQLDALGEEERDSIEAALTGPPPAAGAAEAKLRAHAMGAPRRSDTGLSKLLVSLAAAAAVVAALVLGQPRTSEIDPNILLGEGDSTMAPVGRVPDFARFHWTDPLPAEGWFEVFVYETSPTGGLELLDKSGRLRQNHWSPAEDLHDAWPDRILWKLETHSGSMASDPPKSSLQSAERSPSSS